MAGRASASEALMSAVDTEIIGEMASSLGNAGARWRRRWRGLRQPREGAERSALVKAAADAVYAYFVQRELCGLRRHDDVIKHYSIPREVLVGSARADDPAVTQRWPQLRNTGQLLP